MKYIVCLLLIVSAASADQNAAAAAQRPFGRKSLTTVAPVQTADSVIVNAASYLPGVSPGGLATVFGQDLSSVNGVVVANTNPLPLVLGNVSVTVNGRPAPLFSVAYANGQDQISFQVPYKTETGPGAADVRVYNFNSLVTELITDSFTEDPGIFIYQGKYAVAVAGSDNSLIGPNNPAIPGEVIILYATGLGPLSLDLRDGFGAPSTPLAYTIDPFNVVVNHQQCEVLFSGLGPGFVGLYQINIVLPRNLPAGDLDVQILSPYGDSGIAALPVR
jgi:uncharacterized protein (TIGR03437 family)